MRRATCATRSRPRVCSQSYPTTGVAAGRRARGSDPLQTVSQDLPGRRRPGHLDHPGRHRKWNWMKPTSAPDRKDQRRRPGHGCDAVAMRHDVGNNSELRDGHRHTALQSDLGQRLIDGADPVAAKRRQDLRQAREDLKAQAIAQRRMTPARDADEFVARKSRWWKRPGMCRNEPIAMSVSPRSRSREHGVLAQVPQPQVEVRAASWKQRIIAGAKVRMLLSLAAMVISALALAGSNASGGASASAEERKGGVDARSQGVRRAPSAPCGPQREQRADRRRARAGARAHCSSTAGPDRSLRRRG